MSDHKPSTYPVPTVRRLPLYLRVLRQMEEENQETASCTRIAEALELTSIQVRKDLAMTGAVGRPKIGFEVRPLIKAIEDFLGWNNTKEAFLIGAGHLGTALLKYQGFADCGLKILAGFDVDEEKVGTEIAGKRIFPLSKLQDLTRRMHILIGVLTVAGRVRPGNGRPDGRGGDACDLELHSSEVATSVRRGCRGHSS